MTIESDQIFRVSPAAPIPANNASAMLGAYRDEVEETRAARSASTPARLPCPPPFRLTK